MTMENAKKRIDYLDAAKGIAILAVIVGHFYAPGVIGRIIYSFHLPLFFIISGYCIKDYQVAKSFTRSAKGLLIPYLIGTVLEMVAEAHDAKTFTDGLNGIKTLFIDMIGGFCKETVRFPAFHGTWVLWFLPCLFLARIIFVVLMNVTEKYKYCWYVRTILFLFLAFIGKRMCINGYYPWGMEIAFVSLPFLYFGQLLRCFELLSNKWRYVVAAICLFSWAFLLYKGFYLELAIHYWPCFYLVLLEGMIASLFVLCLTQQIVKIQLLKEGLCWLGRNSLIVLLVHNLDMRYGRWESVFDEALLKNGYFLLSIRIGFALAVTGFVYCGMLWLRKARNH